MTSTFDFGLYRPAGEAVGPAAVGFGNGGFVGFGDGGGGTPTSIVRVGEGKAGVGDFELFEFWFVFSFAFRFSLARSFGDSLASGEGEVLALEFAG